MTFTNVSMGEGPGKTPRERRFDDKHRRILDAALALVERDGLAGLSIHKVAGAVDFTPGALYRYFGSKDALLSGLVTRVLDDVQEHLEEAHGLLPNDCTALSRVFALVHGYRAFALRYPERFGLLATTLADARVLMRERADSEPVAIKLTATFGTLARALASAADERTLVQGDVPERVLCLFALVQGLLQMDKQARHAPNVLDVERLLLRGTSTLLAGWGARESALEVARTEADLVARALQKGRPAKAKRPPSTW